MHFPNAVRYLHFLTLQGNKSVSPEVLSTIQGRLLANRISSPLFSDDASTEARVGSTDSRMSRSSTSSHNSDMSRPSSEKRISVPDISSDAKLELARKVPMRSKSHSNMMRRRSREIRIFEEEEEPPTLVTLFSVPLAYRDGSGKLTAMETLDYETERDLLWQCFCEASRDICLRFGFATTDRLRTEVTKKVRALHYSGHGAETFLSFEDGRGGLRVLETDNLRRLCEAGKKALNGTSSLEFVFVSACHSKFVGEAFAAAGVPHVVCVNVSSSLLDKAAHVFTELFTFRWRWAIQCRMLLILQTERSKLHRLRIRRVRRLSWTHPGSLTRLPRNFCCFLKINLMMSPYFPTVAKCPSGLRRASIAKVNVRVSITLPKLRTRLRTAIRWSFPLI